MNLHWKKLSEKKIRLNRFRSMHEKWYRLPNGRRDVFYTWDCPAVVGALLVTKDHQVVLGKQYRPGPEKIQYESPSGIIETGETPRHAIEREALEETGYSGRVKYLGNSWPDSWSNLHRYHFVIIDAKKVAEPRHDANEVIEVVTVSIPEFIRLMQQGKMTETATAYRGLEALGYLKITPKRKQAKHSKRA